ncbi:MAG: heme ABC transporter ATP-binding protein, partial [Pseudomonadota bacterium]
MTLEARDITVIRSGARLLREVSFAAKAGRFTAICGPNGAGKSTLLGVLAGGLRPDSGQVSLDGRQLDAWPEADLARKRAVVQQSSVLGFPFEVHEVVAMGRTPHEGRETRLEHQAVMAAALTATGMTPFASRNYLTLSGGERQRAHLARALAQVWRQQEDGDTPWLLLDEPTAALDLKHQIEVMRLFHRLSARGWGLVAVLHDLHLVSQYADDIALLADGRIAAFGPVAEVLTPQS